MHWDLVLDIAVGILLSLFLSAVAGAALEKFIDYVREGNMSKHGGKEAFLLGIAFSVIQQVQKHLIQGNHSEALSAINEAVRQFKDEISAHFYAPQCDNQDEVLQDDGA